MKIETLGGGEYQQWELDDDRQEDSSQENDSADENEEEQDEEEESRSRTQESEREDDGQGMNGASPKAAKQMVDERKARHEMEAEGALEQEQREPAEDEETKNEAVAMTDKEGGQDATRQSTEKERGSKRRRLSGSRRRCSKNAEKHDNGR